MAQGTERVRGAVALADVDGEFQIKTATLGADLVDVDATQTLDVERVFANAHELLRFRREELGADVLALLSGLDTPERERVLCALVRTFPELRQVASVAELVSTFGITGEISQRIGPTFARVCVALAGGSLARGARSNAAPPSDAAR